MLYIFYGGKKKILKILKTVGIGSSISPFTKTFLFLALSSLLVCNGAGKYQSKLRANTYCLDLSRALKESTKLCRVKTFFFIVLFWYSPVGLDSVRLKAEDLNTDFHSDF